MPEIPPINKVPGLRWVPRRVPLSRRLETLAVFLCTFWGAILPTFSYVLFYILLYSRLWWLGLIYLFYMVNDDEAPNHGGRRWEYFRNFEVYRYMARYFPVKLVKTAELDPSKNYLAPTCPHGQTMISPAICFFTTATNFPSMFPGITSYLAMAPGRFKTPFLRDINLLVGGVSASEDSIMYLMDKKNKGNLLSINLGGAAEAMEASHDVYKVVVNNRRGYARIAIKTGASIVPIFCFGETRIFNTKPYPEGSWMRKLQNKVRAITGIAPIAVRGRGFFQYNFGIIAFRKPIAVVVGEPIEVKQNLHPTNEEIEEVHNQYVEKLVELFETHKHKYEPDPTIRLVLM